MALSTTSIVTLYYDATNSKWYLNAAPSAPAVLTSVYGVNLTFTEPVLGDFTWENQGGATATAERDAVTLYDPAASSSVSLKILKKAAPTAPYTITVAFLVNAIAETAFQCGVGWRQSSDGKLVVLKFRLDGGHGYVRVSKHASPTGSATDYVNLNISQPSPIFMQITDNSTNRICKVSFDGYNWIQIHSVGRTDYMTGDEVLVYVNALSTSYPMYATWLSWAET